VAPQIITAAVAVAAGAVASIAGFGIGSILTPLLAVWLGTKLAVAVVSIPHLAATALRFWLIREHLDRRVLLSFGVTSAIGGLVGALLHVWLRSAALGYVLAALLVFAGLMGLTGMAQRLRFGRGAAWAAGALSGIFGGLVGNQGGIRSAALLGFEVRRDAFVATATAIALLVDGVSHAGLRGDAMARHFLCLAADGRRDHWRDLRNPRRQAPPGIYPRAHLSADYCDHHSCLRSVDVHPPGRMTAWHLGNHLFNGFAMTFVDRRKSAA
jgi:uncharacterized protein